jgi:hypothetical protein
MTLLTRNFSTTSGTASGGKTNIALWATQGAVALIFLFAGSSKLIMSAEQMSSDMDIPLWFLRFIGVCEVAGALGLILPSILRIRTGLTPLAACGLVVIMVGATTLTLLAGMGAAASFPFVIGLAATFIAYGRTYLAPLGH